MPGTHAPVAGLQVSVPLQALSSLQTTGVPDTQVPVDGLQVSVPLQALPSSQLTEVPGTQSPVAELQVSVPLQALPSSQMTGACAHAKPVDSSHVSVVQESPSSQLAGHVGARTAPGEIWLSRFPTFLPSSEMYEMWNGAPGIELAPNPAPQ